MKKRIFTAAWLLLTLASLALYLFYVYWLVQYFQNPPEGLLNALSVSGISFELFVLFNALNIAGLYLPFFVTAQLIALRRRGEIFPLVAAVSLLAVGTITSIPAFPEFVEFLRNLPLLFTVLFALFQLAFCLVMPFFLVSFPDGKLVPRWTILAALGAVVSNLAFITSVGMWGNLGIAVGAAVLALAGYGACAYAQVWRYRHSLTPLERQQVKWFVFGVAVGAFVMASWSLFSSTWADPVPSNPSYIPILSILLLSGLGLMLLPISVGIAILRYRLWDIDIIIRRTVTYALVTALLLVVFFGSVVVLQQIFAAFIPSGGDALITVFSTLAIAALFVPLRNRVQHVIDRRFNRQKYDAQKVLNEFGETVRDETDLETLTARLMQVVQETMQPRSLSLWLKAQADKRRVP